MIPFSPFRPGYPGGPEGPGGPGGPGIIRSLCIRSMSRRRPCAETD